MKPYLFFLFLSFLFLLSINGVSAVGTMINCSADPSIVACYHFNNGTYENYSFVYDNSQYHKNNITVSGLPLYYSNNDYFGNGSFSLDGVNDFHTIQPNNIFNFTNISGFTVTAWINTSILISGGGDIIEKYVGQDGNRSWSFLIYNNKLNFKASQDGITTVTEIGNTLINNNSGWIFVSAVYRNSNLYVYLNGVVDGGVGTSLNGLIDNFNVPIYIGKNQNFNLFNGSIDEVVIFNKSLSDKEIWDIYSINYGCFNVTENFQAYGDSNFCYYSNQDYLFNDTDANGVINIINNNTNISCNNMLIKGNRDFSLDSYVFNVNHNSSNINIHDCKIKDIKGGIRFFGGNNFNIYNMNFSNIVYGVQFTASPISYVTINNISCYNSTTGGCIFSTNGNINRTNITNSIFMNSLARSIILSTNSKTRYINIFNNIFRDYNFSGSEVFFEDDIGSNFYNNNVIYSDISDGKTFVDITNSKNSQFYNNTIINGSSALTVRNSTNISAFNNYVNNCAAPIFYLSQTNNSKIFNNILLNHHTAIRIKESFNTQIYNNSISEGDIGLYLQNILQGVTLLMNNSYRNNTNNFDSYDLSLWIYNSSNINIINENFSEIATTSMFIQRSSNILIKDSYFYTIPFSQRNNYLANDLSDFPCAIKVTQLYKTYLGNKLEDFGNDILFLSDFKSNNITIQNNTFDVNTQCFLHSEGLTNLTFNMSNSIYLSYWFPNTLIDRTQFFINSIFNNLSKYNKPYEDPVWINGTSNIYIYGYNFNSTSKIIYGNFSWFKNYYYFKDSQYYQNLSLYNLSNSIIYHIQNNTLTRTLGLNLHLNYSLSPNGELYVFNESNYSNYVYTNALGFYPNNYTTFNGTGLINGLFDVPFNDSINTSIMIDKFICNETLQSSTGLPCGRSNSPINISSITLSTISKTYHITSNINNTITVPFVLTYNCTNNTTPLIRPKNGKAYMSVDYSCNNGKFIVNNVNLNYSNDSNEILLFEGGILASYDFTYNSQEQNGFPQGTMFISSSLQSMVGNFFALAPILGTFFGVCILITGLVILVLYLKKNYNQDNTREFQG